MNTVKAAEVIAAIVGAGYECRAVKLGADSWEIRSNSNDFNVNVVTTVAPFAVAESITALLAEVKYI